MTGHLAIRTWAVGVLTGVAASNKVYPYAREIRSQQQFETDFGAAERDSDEMLKARGWTVQVTERQVDAVQGGAAYVDYTLRLVFLMSLYGRGASEVDFWDHIQAAVRALSVEAKPADIEHVYNVLPAQIADTYHVLFGQRLAHRADVTQTIRLREQIRGG